MNWTLFKSPNGDVSARRVASLWCLLYGSAYATAGLVMYAESFSFDVWAGFMIGTFTGLGMTIPDQFGKLASKGNG